MYVRGFILATVLTELGLAFTQSLPNVGHVNFEGQFLVAISDADMVASAYEDGQLGAAQGEDTLSIIRLGSQPSEWAVTSVPVGNAVVGPPTAMTLSPDGRYAIVVETVGSRPRGSEIPTMADLQTSRKITVVDLQNLDKPAVVQTLEGFARPNSVSINAAGDLVAVTHSPDLDGDGRDTPIALYQFRNGTLTLLSAPKIPGWVPGNHLFDANFHPSLDIIVLADITSSVLTMVSVVKNNNMTELELWGNPVQVESVPSTPKFTPDGRYLLANSMNPVPGSNALDGTLASIRLNATTDGDGFPRHFLVSRAVVGVLPEGLAISPNGQWAVTANLERSSFPFDNNTQTFFSSLSLVRINPETGHLVTIGTYAFDGILPEGVVFDASSRFVAATTFDSYDGRNPGGSIDFWRISGDYANESRVELIKTSKSIPVTRGAHSIAVSSENMTAY